MMRVDCASPSPPEEVSGSEELSMTGYAEIADWLEKNTQNYRHLTPSTSSAVIGLTGGLLTGVLTDFFIPDAATMATAKFSLLRFGLQRLAVRSVAGVGLFCGVETLAKMLGPDNEHRWVNSVAAGALCGQIFGLTGGGGIPGVVYGATSFALLPAIRAFNHRVHKLQN